MKGTRIVSRQAVPVFALVLAVWGGCSSSNGANQDAATGSGGTGGASTGNPGTGGSGDSSALTVTSTAFTEAQSVATENTCAGANTSPPLTWTAGPATTMSYSVTLTDLSINTIHWVIWDIPSTTHALPAALPLDAVLTNPSGAKQAHHIPFFGNTDNGYRGPCPSGALHTYRYEVRALDVATLPMLTTSSTPPDVDVQITAHWIARGALSATSTASMAGQ